MVKNGHSGVDFNRYLDPRSYINLPHPYPYPYQITGGLYFRISGAGCIAIHTPGLEIITRPYWMSHDAWANIPSPKFGEISSHLPVASKPTSEISRNKTTLLSPVP